MFLLVRLHHSRSAFPSLTGLEIDIDNVSPDDRARSYIKRAGILIATSPEAKAQEHREATTLMAIYTSPADVPPSAKEPPPPDMDEMVPEVLSFGELPDHVKVCSSSLMAICQSLIICRRLAKRSTLQ
jgi:hypothetical protein